MIGSTRRSISSGSATAAKTAPKPPVISSLAEKRNQRKREKLNSSLDKSRQLGTSLTGGEMLDKTAMSLATLE